MTFVEHARNSPDGLSAVVTESGAPMGKRRTPGQRVVEYFMRAPIAEARLVLEALRMIVDARVDQDKHAPERIALERDIVDIVTTAKATRKPRAKKAAPPAVAIDEANNER